MGKFVNIKDNDFESTLCEFLDPDLVYVPYDKSYKLCIRDGDKICFNDAILKSDSNTIYSPISGEIKGATRMICDGEYKPCIVIENDFEERKRNITYSKRNLRLYDKLEASGLIKSYTDISEAIEGETLIISGFDKDPFEHVCSSIICENTDNLLECIDAFISIFGFHKCFLAVNSGDSDVVSSLVNYIGTYPNIDLRLMPSEYPLGFKDILVKELVSNNKLDKGICFLSVSEVMEIYHALKKRRPSDKSYVYIKAPNSKGKSFHVKNSSSFKDIINRYYGSFDDKRIVINGLMSGYEIKNLDGVVTPKVRSIFLIDKAHIKEEECINCGLCNMVCPMGCDPLLNYKMDKCIKCGLCTYMCPSKREVIKWVLLLKKKQTSKKLLIIST